MEKVSVIVPVYNSEEYLHQCLDSILQQTYTNLEIILMNDGSTDRSAKICEEYKAQDSRVKVYHKQNGGVSSSRNRALEVVSGDYIVFVDNDDWLVPHHVEVLYDLLKRTDADIAIANFMRFKQDGITYLHTREDDVYERVYTSFEWFKVQYEAEAALSHVFTAPWTKIYKTSLFQDVVYPTNRAVEDDYTTYKVYLKADKIAYVNKPIYIHRDRPGSASDSADLLSVFPIESIAERVMILLLAGAPRELIDMEVDAYRLRLGIHKDALLSMGDMEAYYQVKVKEVIHDKYRK